MEPPTISDFLDMSVLIGTVVRCEVNKGARDKAFCLWIDFGTNGVKQSSAKIADNYEPQAMVGRQVMAVTAFAPLRVGGFRSDVLVLGAATDSGVVLVTPDRPVAPGSRVE